MLAGLRAGVSETMQGVSLNCHEVLFSTMPQVAMRAPFAVARHVLWPSSNSWPRAATCGMVLNNTSWQFSDTPCVVSDAPVRRPAGTQHAHHHHGG